MPTTAHPGVAGLRTRSARWARVVATHTDGTSVETRSDGRGRAVLAGLPTGRWTVTAHDVRRDLCSAAVVVTLDSRSGPVAPEVDLSPITATARLVVDVRGSDPRPVRAVEVRVTDSSGRAVVAVLHGGLADVGGLRPGAVRVVVPPSIGHLGTSLDVELEAGALAAATAVVPVGATVTGRVVQRRGPQHAAVVALLDAAGRELERARTDEEGRFVLGTGLGTVDGLTVVATSGPETLHVTRAAVADVGVVAGVRHDLGDVVLPVAGPRTVWSARTRAATGTGLPPTGVWRV